MRTDIVIVGGGPAGLAAAIAAAKEDATLSILILERDHELGGILNQCIHNGFGLHTFNEELTGPEYAERFEQQLSGLNIQYMLDTMVLDVSSGLVTAVNSAKGVFEVECGAVVLCMGCRERPRGALNIPGLRPAGVFTAGTAQRLVNIEGYMPGKEVVILGSGDIGLIMARRMTLEGAKVKAVCELMPYSGGLKRNIVQCLDDFDIPLLLSHTVIDIKGKERVNSVVIAEVDSNSKPIPGTEQEITCDTLLLSCGLIPENELSRAADIKIDPATNGPVVNESFETSVPGIFACGNVLHVHDLVDYVSEESGRAGKSAARFVKNSLTSDSQSISIRKGNGVRYTVPSTVRLTNLADDLIIRFRSTGVFKDAYVDVLFDGEQKLHRRKQIITPGEMEQVILKREDLAQCPSEITVTITES
ncbi:MAG: NAD(P)/FAD-dependent oxidoreductase [Saccharofermentans sp.]|nr:NAD(P)/FAD-dependent oxidoreductase [Saccharofermentans sp.]